MLRVLLAIPQPRSSRSCILTPSISSETAALSLEFGLPAQSQGLRTVQRRSSPAAEGSVNAARGGGTRL